MDSFCSSVSYLNVGFSNLLSFRDTSRDAGLLPALFFAISELMKSLSVTVTSKLTVTGVQTAHHSPVLSVQAACNFSTSLIFWNVRVPSQIDSNA